MTELPTHMLAPGNAGLPIGLRASAWAACPVQCFIGFLDPDRYFDFDPGIGQAGHDLADLFIERILSSDDCETRAEVPITWKHGTSHIDALVTGGDKAGLWELKSTYKDPRIESIAPSAVNRRQVRIQLYLAEKAGLEIPGPARIAIIAKKDWSLHGPWTIDLSDDDRAIFDAELAQIDSWMERVETIDLDGDMELIEACQCGACFKPVYTFMDSLSNKLDREWHEIVTVPRTQAEWKQADKLLKSIRADVKAIMVEADETHAETHFYKASLSKTGTLTIKAKPMDAVAA